MGQLERDLRALGARVRDREAPRLEQREPQPVALRARVLDERRECSGLGGIGDQGATQPCDLGGAIVIAITESGIGRDHFRVVHLASQVPASPSKSVLPVSAGPARGLTGIGFGAIGDSC